MSRQAGAGDDAGLAATLEYGLRYLILLLVPAATVMAFLAREIIAAALQRGAFLPENTLLAAKVLVAYSLGLLSVGAFNFFQRFFYAKENYKTPLVSAFIVCALDIALSLVLKKTPLRVAGLALANTLAFTLGVVIMWFQAASGLRRASPVSLNAGFALLTLAKSLAASAPAAVFMYFFVHFAGPWWQEGSGPRGLLCLALALAGAAAIILIMYRLMKIDILMSMLRREKEVK
jgi:putative peptidoglycan lipid II flippase